MALSLTLSPQETHLAWFARAGKSKAIGRRRLNTAAAAAAEVHCIDLRQVASFAVSAPLCGGGGFFRTWVSICHESLRTK